MWDIGEKKLNCRLMVGTALYPSPDIMRDAIRASGAEVVTVSLRRQTSGALQRQVSEQDGGERFWELIQSLDVQILPNTAGCRNVKEAVTTAHMARELFQTRWIKLEVIGDDYNLQPDPFALVEAARILHGEGFEVFPYTTDDYIVAQKLVEAGCRILMPWVAPIGTGKGILNPYALNVLRQRFPTIQLIADAGIGLPSHAARVMELGFDGVLLNSAIALAENPVAMARAFGLAVAAGAEAYRAGPMPERELAAPSTPVSGTPFWHQLENRHVHPPITPPSSRDQACEVEPFPHKQPMETRSTTEGWA
jgi:thiazole synthase